VSTLQIPWRRALCWYVVMVALCAIGTFLAYKSPLSSAAWDQWSGTGAWKRDTMRAVVCAALSLFVLWNLEVLPPRDLLRETPPLWPHFALYEKILLAAIFAALVFLAFVVLPASFKADLIKNHWSLPLSFREIMVPYFPYLLYMVSLWLGIVTPAFIFLLRRASSDLRWWREARARLYKILSKQITVVDELSLSMFQELLAAFQNYVIGLKNIAERYLPVLLAIALALLHEQLTPTYKTVTPTAVEYAKAACWLFLGPALFIFILLVALGYQSAVKKAETGFSPYIDLLVTSPEKGEVLNAFLVLRTNLIWQQSPLTFIITAVKSASVALPLLIALTGYVLKNVIDKTAWPSLFLPDSVLEALKNFYR